jgi:hypothetical protein
VVELLDRADQPDDPLLDQIEQCQLVSLPLLRDRDDEPQVRVDHQLLRVVIAALDPLRQLDFLGGGQQAVAPHLVQEELQRVGRRVGQVAVQDLRPVGGGAAAIVLHLDPVRLQLLVERSGLVLVEMGGLHERVDLRQLDAARGLEPLHERAHVVWQRTGHDRPFSPGSSA